MTDEIDRECPKCKGSGECLVRLPPEQDFGYAQRGIAIPKTTCWVCDGAGVVTGQSTQGSKE